MIGIVFVGTGWGALLGIKLGKTALLGIVWDS